MYYVTSLYLRGLLYAVVKPLKPKAKDEKSQVAGKYQVCIVFHFVTSGLQKASVHHRLANVETSVCWLVLWTIQHAVPWLKI